MYIPRTQVDEAIQSQQSTPHVIGSDHMKLKKPFAHKSRDGLLLGVYLHCLLDQKKNMSEHGRRPELNE